jgi:hypothetical protein
MANEARLAGGLLLGYEHGGEFIVVAPFHLLFCLWLPAYDRHLY